MTNEEAIKELESLLIVADDDFIKKSEAIQIAIEALKFQTMLPAGDCVIIPQNGVWIVNGIDMNEAIDKILKGETNVRPKALWEHHEEVTAWPTEIKYEVLTCSICGYSTSTDSSNYCPNCGAEMVGEVV